METTHLNFNMSDRIGLKGLLTQRFFHFALERKLQEVSTFDIRSEATLEDVDKLFSEMKDVTRYAYLPIDPKERGLFAAYMYDLGDTLIFVTLGDDEVLAKFPKSVVDFLEKFDSEEPVEPFSFTLNINKRNAAKVGIKLG